MPESQLLRVENLTWRNRSMGRVILDRIDMTIDPGERIGLMGISGSGKSSLLRAIARLDQCDEGSVVFRGDVVAGDLVPPFRRQVIYLPQRPSLLAGTVRENLQIPFRLSVSQHQYDESVVVGLLSDLKKPLELLDQSAESLSGGEQQIVAMIRAILLRPIILLLDEPSASLDPNTTAQLERLVLTWQQQCEDGCSPSRALIWTSHDADQISRMTTRVLRMDSGRLLSEEDE